MPDLYPFVKRLDGFDPRDDPRASLRRKVEEGVLRVAGTRVDHRDGGLRRSVNVVFLGGTEFDSPPPLGTTGRTRYVKVKTLDEADEPEMRSWIEQAGRVPGWK